MSHRASLLHLLTHYRPIDDTDRLQAGRLAAFVRRQPACFNRDCWEGHVTGSAWVVSPTGDQVLLTHHKKLNMWLQLGGHADGQPDILAVAQREAEEESGISGLTLVDNQIFDLDVHSIPARPNEPAHHHYDVRFAFQSPGADFRVSSESHSLAWVDINRLSEKTTEPSMLRMAEKWKILDRNRKSM